MGLIGSRNSCDTPAWMCSHHLQGNVKVIQLPNEDIPLTYRASVKKKPLSTTISGT